MVESLSVARLGSCHISIESCRGVRQAPPPAAREVSGSNLRRLGNLDADYIQIIDQSSNRLTNLDWPV